MHIRSLSYRAIFERTDIW